MGSFIKAVRAGAPVVIGIVSKSGFGKTYSALRVARGLVGPSGKIAGLDTESGRMRLYADLTDFDHCELEAPFAPSRYIEKIKEAVAAGYDCLVIDQGTFEWDGSGGILDMAEATNAKGLQKWNAPKVQHRKFMNALAECPIHIVICLRGKDEVLQDPKTKEVTKTGRIVAQQNHDFLYEMTVSMTLDIDGKPGVPRIVKCPDQLRGAFPDGDQLSERAGQMIAAWVKGGAPVDHAFEAIKSAAREMALEGTKAFKAWLLSGAVPKDQWPKLKPLVDSELASAAKSADAMIALSEPNEPVAPAADILSDTPKAVA